MSKELKIEDILNRHINQPAFICGHGPSLNPYLQKLDDIKKKYILFDTNEWYNIHNTVPHYWVLSNTVSTLFRMKDKINISNSTMIYADSVDTTDREWIKKNIFVDYLAYDQRHFQNKRCIELLNSELKKDNGFDPTEICCKHIIKGRKTIQETLKEISGYNRQYSTGHTVFVHMLVFAILMKCNPIYFTGVDLDYRLGHAGNLLVGITKKDIYDYLTYYNRIIIEDLKIINESAKLLNIEIYNVNKKSPFDIFEIKDLD